jgi:thiol-disulfide isomerase/thioredoxin
MNGAKGGRWILVSAIIVTGVGGALAEVRSWSDATGKFKVEAEFQSLKDGKIHLRTTQGKDIAVPLERLSDKDRAVAEKLSVGEKPAQEAAPKKPAAVDPKVETQLKELTDQFYKDLRTKERTAARDLLTETAKKMMESGKSPLASLPSPDAAANGIKIGKVNVDGKLAEVIVFVRVGGMPVKTILHFRGEAEVWQVFAVSAKLGEDEKTLNFEKPAGSSEKQADPLLALIGKPMAIEGYTVEGKKLRMDQFEGKVVLIDFWATWCGPCRAEMPNILANWQEYHDRGFEVIAISVDENLNDLRKFVTEENPPWTVVADYHPNNHTKMEKKYKISGIPAFVLIGKDGNVAAVHCRGPRLGKELSKLLGDTKTASVATP